MTDRLNRGLWSLLGALLLAGGVLGIVASAGGLPGTDTRSPLLWSWALETWRDAGRWAPAAVAAAGVLVLALGLLLVRLQLRFAPAGPKAPADLSAPGSHGITELRTTSLGRALAADLRRVPGVEDAQVVLRGTLHETDVQARVDVGPHARLDRVADGIAACLARYTVTTDGELRSCDITVRPAAGDRPRVA